MPEKCSYHILCSPTDNTTPGRQWADWLGKAIADYELPEDLRRTVPLPLEESGFLAVICSPAAVESQRVADDIRWFKESGKAHRILAVIVDGEPNVSGKSGEGECLPEPLRFGVTGEDGKIDWEQETEPVIVDLRPDAKPGQGWTTSAAYREDLKKTAATEKEIVVKAAVYMQRLEVGKLKVIGGILGVPFTYLQERSRRPVGVAAKPLPPSRKASPAPSGIIHPPASVSPPVMPPAPRSQLARVMIPASIILCMAVAGVMIHNRYGRHNPVAAPDPFELKNPGTHGLGTLQDYASAEELYESATDQDKVEMRGKQGTPDETEETERVADLQTAADQGDADAQVSLGWIYAHGLGVARSYARAIEYFQKAAGRGNAEAQYRLGWLYEFGLGTAQDYTKAAGMFQKAAGQGYADAEYNLGWFYLNGMGVAQSYTKAAELLQRAADKGNAGAQASMGLLYAKGLGVPQSYAKAAGLFQKAADQGNADAQYNLGVLNAGGAGVEQSYAKAAALYQQAAGRGNAAARNNLGVLYANGQGVEKDINHARELYEEAAAQGDDLAKSNLARLEKPG